MAATNTQTNEAISSPRPVEVEEATTRRGQMRAGNLVKGILLWVALGAALLFFLFPLLFMVSTSFKLRSEVTSLPPRYIPFLDFTPTLDNYGAVFTKSSELGTINQSQDQRTSEASDFGGFLLNSVIIAGGATLAAVIFGTLAAYAFSRFKVKGEGDMLFFILSTRMLPAVVVLIPIFLMFTKPLGFLKDTFLDGLSTFTLRDSYLGIMLLYTTVGLPFVVWMMKGFFDEIPKEYEEAAMLDGYSRLEAIWKFVLPEALPAMLATAVFVLITAWNEFVFVVKLNPGHASTVPPFLLAIIGYGQVEWGRMAATSVVFLLPVVLFTFAVRNHLLRGVTFGAVRR